jgi:hypothetical protein
LTLLAAVAVKITLILFRSEPSFRRRPESSLNTSCEAHKIYMSCAAHIILHWIPAFAGMTSGGVEVQGTYHAFAEALFNSEAVQ